MGQFVVDRGSQVSKVEDLAMARCERGHCPPYIGELWDAAARGSFESVSTLGHETQISVAEVWAVAEGERERWPFDVNELIVITMDVATMGYSASESTNGMRSHRFLLNNRECATVPYLAHQLTVFCKLD